MRAVMNLMTRHLVILAPSVSFLCFLFLDLLIASVPGKDFDFSRAELPHELPHIANEKPNVHHREVVDPLLHGRKCKLHTSDV